MFNKRFIKTYSHSLNEQEEEEKKDKSKNIKFDIVKFLTDIGASECINKLQKEDLLEPELFFEIEEDTLLEHFGDLKPEGKKMKAIKEIKDIREKYKKEGTIEYIDLGLLEDGTESGP